VISGSVVCCKVVLGIVRYSVFVRYCCVLSGSVVCCQVVLCVVK